MKKILFSIMIIAVVAAAAIGGTMAYFNSTNSVTGTFSAATFNVTANDTIVSLNFTGLIPGGPAGVSYVQVKNDGEMDAWVKVTTGDWTGDSDLLNALHVKVTALAPGEEGVGGLYPGANYPSYDGPLVGLYIDNVGGGTPMPAGQFAVYKVEVTLDFLAPNSLQGKTAGASLILHATQSAANPTGSTTDPNAVQW